jgi:hypothetical protein
MKEKTLKLLDLILGILSWTFLFFFIIFHRLSLLLISAFMFALREEMIFNWIFRREKC